MRLRVWWKGMEVISVDLEEDVKYLGGLLVKTTKHEINVYFIPQYTKIVEASNQLGQEMTASFFAFSTLTTL